MKPSRVPALAKAVMLLVVLASFAQALGAESTVALFKTQSQLDFENSPTLRQFLIADSLVLTSPGDNMRDKLEASLGKEGFKKASLAFVIFRQCMVVADVDWKPTRGVTPGTFRILIPFNDHSEIEALVNGQTVWKHIDAGTNIASPELTIPLSGDKPDVTIRVRKRGMSGGVNDVWLLRPLSEKSVHTKGAKLETPPINKTDAGLPAFEERLVGPNEVRIRNPNEFNLAAGIRLGTKGADLDIPAKSTASIFVPDGQHDIYFLYSNQPNALFRGEKFNLNGNGVEIHIVEVVGGNYGIRRVK